MRSFGPFTSGFSGIPFADFLSFFILIRHLGCAVNSDNKSEIAFYYTFQN
jgi:hypothetical protein